MNKQGLFFFMISDKFSGGCKENYLLRNLTGKP